MSKHPPRAGWQAALAALHPVRVHETLRLAMAKVRGGQLTPGCVARSVAWGAFVGASPFFGLHTVLCLIPAVPLRLDPLIAYVASNISIPPMIPILLYSEAQVGSLVLRGHTLPLSLHTLAPEQFWDVSSSLVVGFLVVGSVLSGFLGTIAWFVARAWLKDRGQSSGEKSADFGV